MSQKYFSKLCLTDKSINYIFVLGLNFPRILTITFLKWDVDFLQYGHVHVPSTKIILLFHTAAARVVQHLAVVKIVSAKLKQSNQSSNISIRNRVHDSVRIINIIA